MEFYWECWYNLCSALNCATDSSPCSPSCTCPICGSPTGGCSACNAPLCIRLGYKFSVGTTASGEFEAILTGSGGCVSTYSWSGSFEFEPAAPGYVLTGITIQFVKGNMFAWFYMTVIGTPGSNIVPATLAAANDTPSDVCSEWYVTSMILPDVKIYKLPMGPGEMGQIWVRALQFGDCPI